MNIDLAKLLEAAEQTLDGESAAKARVLLRDPETRLVDGAPTREEVRQLLPILKARQINSGHTGKRIFGLDRMVLSMDRMEATALVVGYGFISPSAAGNFYISDESQEMLGATIVDR